LGVTAFSATLGLTLSSLLSRYFRNRFITTLVSSFISVPLYFGIGYGSLYLASKVVNTYNWGLVGALGLMTVLVTILNAAFVLKAMQFKRSEPPKYDY
jgi:hypothetical protein